MKKRIQIVGSGMASLVGDPSRPASKYIHCVEATENSNKIVVDWGVVSSPSGSSVLEITLRYRCQAFPSIGTFFLLIFADPFQSILQEVWQVVISTKQRLDVHGSVGSTSHVDLIVRGDRFSRRARAYAALTADSLLFQPDSTFQLVPGVYNRLVVAYKFMQTGSRRVQINLVDADSRELISSWLLTTSGTEPAILRTYEVDVFRDRPTNKKIIFKNPWDISRTFTLTSSNSLVMRPR